MKTFLDSFFRKQKMGDDDRQIKYIKVWFNSLLIDEPQLLVDSPCALQLFVGGDGLHPDGDEPDPGKP